MAKKAPRRTAQRILEVTLELFNRYGEPNVPTTHICGELNISPGNLYYHYPSKDALINALFDDYETALLRLLDAADGVQDVEDAWFYIHTLFELIWQHRFLYRDLNHLLSNNRRLETHIQSVLQKKLKALQSVLLGLQAQELLHMQEQAIQACSTCMVVVLTYWLSFEYVLDPRRALEPESAQLALLRGAHHVLNLLVPYLQGGAAEHMQGLMTAYQTPAPTPAT
jgi:AcrR family transcriptional regulator